MLGIGILEDFQNDFAFALLSRISQLPGRFN
jgi:hypothetical protein